MSWVQVLLPLLIEKVDFTGFSSEVNLFLLCGFWKDCVAFIMYLYLFSVGFTCYGTEWALEAVTTKSVIT